MKEIIKQLEYITSRGYSHFNVFSDWLDLMIYALMSNDEEYFGVVRKYKNDRKAGEREIDFFANAFGLLMRKMKESNDELLGEIYMNWNMSNKYNCQFFTPKHIASFIAQIAEPKTGMISEPCCGSGVMLIEVCKLMSFDGLDNSLFIAQDIDSTCVKMCALNMTFFNLNAYIICGNTLLMNDYQRVFQTGRSYLGGSIRELSQDEIEIIKPNLEEQITWTATKKINQLTLF